MKSSTVGIQCALAGVLAIGLGTATDAAAADAAMEKCAGIVKAGKNDCATSTTACHGSVHSDAAPEAWIYLPQGTCEKIVGGHISLQKAPHEKSSSVNQTRRYSLFRG